MYSIISQLFTRQSCKPGRPACCCTWWRTVCRQVSGQRRRFHPWLDDSRTWRCSWPCPACGWRCPGVGPGWRPRSDWPHTELFPGRWSSTRLGVAPWSRPGSCPWADLAALGLCKPVVWVRRWGIPPPAAPCWWTGRSWPAWVGSESPAGNRARCRPHDEHPQPGTGRVHGKQKQTHPQNVSQWSRVMDLIVYLYIQTLTFLMAYLGSSGITRTIFPSQNSATTRSFFQPWKHNREKTELLQSGAKKNREQTSPTHENKLMPAAALAEKIWKIPNSFRQKQQVTAVLCYSAKRKKCLGDENK